MQTCACTWLMVFRFAGFLCASLLVLGNQSNQSEIKEDIERIVVTKPDRGGVVEVFCNENSNHEYLAFRFIWTDTPSFENERQCRALNVTATVNGNMMNVGTDLALCSGQDYIWVVKNVCVALWPFKEGANELHLNAFGVREYSAASRDFPFEITVDRSDNPQLAEDVSII